MPVGSATRRTDLCRPTGSSRQLVVPSGFRPTVPGTLRA